MALLIDKILEQKPYWLNPADNVEGTNTPDVDDTIYDSDGNIVQLPKGDSNRIVGTLWGHIKLLCQILLVGHNNDGSHTNKINLNEISDVDNSLSPSDGQILVYDSADGVWKAQDSSLSTHNLAYHSDVDDSLSPNDGQALVYDASLGYWTSKEVLTSDDEIDGGNSFSF